MWVSPNPDTIIRIRRVGQEPDCSVCESKDSGQVCDPNHLTLKEATNASVEFTCPQPQEVFAVEINREIGTTITDLMNCDDQELFQRHLMTRTFLCLRLQADPLFRGPR